MSFTKDDAGQFAADITTLNEDQLPAGEVRVRVAYSTLNYKDGLAITNKSPVVRSWPMVPGIDLAGEVIESADARFKPGDAVLLNGWGAGEVHWGGLAQQARVKGDWLLLRPAALSAQRAMAIGTAGYTAMLCLMALQDAGVKPEAGEILVTGATGGVGSVATALLAQQGYRVVASTGKASEADYLKQLGAADVMDRAALSAPGKPLQKERWAGVIDSVGSHTLANACAQTKYGGTVTACGLAQGMDPGPGQAGRHDADRAAGAGARAGRPAHGRAGARPCGGGCERLMAHACARRCAGARAGSGFTGRGKS